MAEFQTGGVGQSRQGLVWDGLLFLASAFVRPLLRLLPPPFLHLSYNPFASALKPAHLVCGYYSLVCMYVQAVVLERISVCANGWDRLLRHANIDLSVCMAFSAYVMLVQSRLSDLASCVTAPSSGA